MEKRRETTGVGQAYTGKADPAKEEREMTARAIDTVQLERELDSFWMDFSDLRPSGGMLHLPVGRGVPGRWGAEFAPKGPSNLLAIEGVSCLSVSDPGNHPWWQTIDRLEQVGPTDLQIAGGTGLTAVVSGGAIGMRARVLPTGAPDDRPKMPVMLGERGGRFWAFASLDEARFAFSRSSRSIDLFGYDGGGLRVTVTAKAGNFWPRRSSRVTSTIFASKRDPESILSALQSAFPEAVAGAESTDAALRVLTVSLDGQSTSVAGSEALLFPATD